MLAALVVAASTTAGSNSPETESWTLHLTAPRPDLHRAEGGNGLLPSIEGFGTSDRPGEPALPVRLFLVAIPEGGVPDLRIVRAASESLGRLDLAPVPRLRQADRGEADGGGQGTDQSPAAEQVRGAGSGPLQYLADPGIFNQDREFPDAPVRLGKIGYLRQQRFVEVIFQPLVYNPVRREARLFHDMVVEIRFGLPAGPIPASPARPDPHFEATYRRSLVNYEQGKQFRVARGAVTAPGRPADERVMAQAIATAQA
ncbi:MAG TPA: C25 family peptidase propeptide domain-containing protein, partial [Candidatus Polarisedimenticolia bacterium]|nr:C25 family peptidase propeptide domain-containing protein [Candidatus Polarisedimenticolia bacterium]